jgi:Mrp family chromosome partitioning ATPase
MGREAGDRRHHARVPIAAKHITIYLPGADGRERPHAARLVDLSPVAIGVSAPGTAVSLGTSVGIEVGRGWWRRATVPGVVCRISDDGTRWAIQFAAEGEAARKHLDGFITRAYKTFDRLLEKADGAQLAESLRRVELELGPAKNDGPRIVVLTSAVAIAGKGAVAAGLSVVLADEGRRVLLVDIDDRPALVGVNGDTTREAPTAPISRNVDLLSIGSDQEFAPLLKRLQSSAYHFVILNAPPLLGSANAVQLAKAADDVFVVAETSISKERDLSQVRDLLARGNAPFRGVILSDDSSRPYRSDHRGRRPSPLLQSTREESEPQRVAWEGSVRIDQRRASESKVTS